MGERIACDICRKPYERGSEVQLQNINNRAVWVCYVCFARGIAQSYLPRWLPRWFKHLVF